jgi:RHS repeat-associated protein
LGNIRHIIKNGDTVSAFSYNDAQRLTRIESVDTVNFEYDRRHQRIRRNEGATTITFTFDQSATTLSEYNDTMWLADYIYIRGIPLATISAADPGSPLYYITDHLGTPMVLIDSQTTEMWSAEWFPYGEIYEEYASVVNNIRFPGQWRDELVYYNWHRYYHPCLGRYGQTDPLGIYAGANPYLYALGNPVEVTDADGRFPTIVTVALFGGIIKAGFSALEYQRRCGWDLEGIASASWLGLWTGTTGTFSGLLAFSLTRNPHLSAAFAAATTNYYEQLSTRPENTDPLEGLAVTVTGGVAGPLAAKLFAPLKGSIWPHLYRPFSDATAVDFLAPVLAGDLYSFLIGQPNQEAGGNPACGCK